MQYHAYPRIALCFPSVKNIFRKPLGWGCSSNVVWWAHKYLSYDYASDSTYPSPISDTTSKKIT